MESNNIYLKSKIRERVLKRYKEEKIKTWIPTETQEYFIRDKHPIRVFLGGNRSGKSETGIIEVICYAIGYRPYMSKDDPDYKTPFKPPIRIRVFGEDYNKHIGGVLIPKLRNWIPKSEFEFSAGNPKKNQNGIPVVWTFKNGSVIELLSYEQDSSKAEGWDGSLALFDEPPPRKMFTATWRGLTDHGGHCLFTMTPIKEPWVYEEFILKKTPEFAKYVKTYFISIYDNIKHEREWPPGSGIKRMCGGLTKENVERFLAGVPEDEKRARMEGKFNYMEGLVFEEFDPSFHVKPYFEPPPEWTRYEHIDVHPSKPWSIVFIAVSPDGKIYQYDELEIAGNYDTIIEAIKIKRFHHGTKKYIRPYITLIDPLATVKEQLNETSIADRLYELSGGEIDVEPASKKKDVGIQELKHKLRKKKNIYDEEEAEFYVM